jgi:spermidine synthase
MAGVNDIAMGNEVATGERATSVRRAVVLLFLASGFCGLVYQVAWVRLLTPVFGVTAYAISTVIASFMAGLALGSFVAGRRIDARRDPLRIYALLEVGIGIYALATPLLFGATDSVVHAVYRLSGEGSPLLFGVLRAAIAFAILVVPTTLMGATLPVLCKFMIERLERVGRETGRLYFINTLGAVIGCASAGFYLIPSYGLHAAIALAALVNLLIGGVAYLLQRQAGEGGSAVSPNASAGEPRRALSWAMRWMVAAFALSGLTALILELIWTRVLILIFGNTVYSVAAMLSVFLLGIALGGALFGRLADRSARPYRLLGAMLCAIGLVILAEAAAINHLPSLFLRLLVSLGVQDSSLTLIKFVISFAVLFPLTLIFGGTFPVVSKVCTESLRHTGREIGSIYAMNTLGAIVGALFGGFVIVPLVGMRHGLMVAAWLALASGVVTLLLRGVEAKPQPKLAAGFATAGVLATLLLPAWNVKLLSIPVWFSPGNYIGADGSFDLNEATAETRNLFYAEGVNDTIIVNENPTERILSINGKIIASTQWDDFQHLKMLGHLPYLIHPGHPRTALNIGLGVGGTVSGLSAHNLERVTGAELEPKVVEANPLFGAFNDHVLDNPKFGVVIADGRNFLSMTGRKFDIIASDPNEVFMTGAGNLYSREFFEIAKRHLNPDGLLVQWVPLYQIGDTEFRALLKTFNAMFPHATAWFAGKSLVLIGSEKRLELDPAVLRTRMAERDAVATLKRLGMDTPERLLPFLLADEKSLAPYLADAPMNTDSFPIVEYASAWAILKRTTGPNLSSMSRYFLPPQEVLTYVRNGSDERSIDKESARALVVQKRRGIDAMIAAIDGRPQAAIRTLTSVVEQSGDPYMAMYLAQTHEEQGVAALARGAGAVAAQEFEAALRLGPERPVSLGNLGYLRYLAGNLPEARALLERAYGLFPASVAIQLRLALVCDAQGETARGEELYESAVRNRPDLRAKIQRKPAARK